MTKFDEKECLTTHQAAEYCGISNAHLFNLWKAGKGPKRIKLGRRTLVLMSALQDWLNDLSEGSNEEKTQSRKRNTSRT